MEMTLTMPRGAIIMDTEEMTYIDGGATFTVNGTTAQIRTRLNNIIANCVAGNIVSAALGAALGGIAGAVIGALAGNSWFSPILGYARTAHSKVEGFITKHGTSKACKMTSTWSTIFCTGISVSV